MDKLIELCEQVGLEGKELLTFISEQQEIQREVRTAELEVEKLKAEVAKIDAEVQLQVQKEKLHVESEIQKEKLRVADDKAKREEALAADQQRLDLEKEKVRLTHELEIAKAKHKENPITSNIITPELPTFDDGRDNIDAYIERFERFATIQKWDTGMWAIILSTLLTGKALQIYARLPTAEADNYNAVKAALLKGYNQTETGYRMKFRDSKLVENESTTQFITRISCYLDKWTKMANVTNYHEFRSLVIREQFLNQCPKDLAVYLKERQYVSMENLCNQAERYLEARGQTLNSITYNKTNSSREQVKDTTTEQIQRCECYNCGRLGHRRAACRMEGGGNQQRCTHCNIYGLNVETCRNNKTVAGGIQIRAKTASNGNAVKDRMQRKPHEGLKTVTGKVGNQVVNTLRDTGCNAICVKKKFVRKDQMTGEHKKCTLIDGSERSLETAIVDINTPYLRKRGTTVVCLEDGEYDLVIGDVGGARCKCSPNPDWTPD